MNAIGGQEITMPVIHPADIWKQSGRWGIPEMFKLRDRYGRDLCLGMTHEEVIACLAAREIRSYRDLPQIWYQIQTKERDEARPRSGVLRTREFLMKDAYTLDPDVAALDRSYAAHERAYRRIFDRCGLRYWVVQSDTGMMGGLGSHEFMAPAAAGEGEIAPCEGCGDAPHIEIGPGGPASPPFPARAREGGAAPRRAAETARVPPGGASPPAVTSPAGSPPSTPSPPARRASSAASHSASRRSSRSATSSSSARSTRRRSGRRISTSRGASSRSSWGATASVRPGSPPPRSSSSPTGTGSSRRGRSRRCTRTSSA